MSRRLKNGYRTIATGHVGEVYEHVVVAERALGRPLPAGVEVHHVNEDKTDNRNSNLVICQDKAYHKLLHFRMRILAAGGNPNTDKLCSGCQRFRPHADFNKGAGPYGLQSQCRECQSSYQKHYVRSA